MPKKNGNADEKKTAKDLEKKLDDLTKYEQTVTIDTKKNTQKTTLKLAAKNNGTTVSADVKIENQAKNSNKSVALPKKPTRSRPKKWKKSFLRQKKRVPSFQMKTSMICLRPSEVGKHN